MQLVNIDEGEKDKEGDNTDRRGRKKDDRDTLDVNATIEALGMGRFQIFLILCVGAIWIADAAEIILISFLSPILRCHWSLSSAEESTITTVVFLGMLLGAPFWGWVDDRKGRRFGYISSLLCTVFFGLLSAASNGLPMMLVTRMCVGFSVVGSHVAITMFTEWLPSKYRAFGVMMIGLLWSVGAIFEALLAWIIVPNMDDPEYNWRVLMVASAAPLICLLALSPFVPESPRWLVTENREAEAIRTLQRAAKMNGIDSIQIIQRRKVPGVVPPAENSSLVQNEASSTNNKDNGCRRYLDLVRIPVIQRLAVLWLLVCAVYYGTVLLTTGLSALENAGDRCPSGDNGANTTAVTPEDDADDSCDTELTSEDYADALYDSVAEIPGLLACLWAINVVGRRRTIAGGMLMCSVAYVLLVPCVSHAFEQGTLWMARLFIAGVFQVLFIYTPEIFTTEIRARGLGLCVAFARVGGMATPLISTILLQASDAAALICYAVSCMAAAILMVTIRYETKDRPIGEAFRQILSERKGSAYLSVQ